MRRYWITASRLVAQALAERERDKPEHNWMFIDVLKCIIYFMRPTTKNSDEDHLSEVFCEFCPVLYRVITAYADWTADGIVSSGTSGRASKPLSLSQVSEILTIFTSKTFRST